ncbi:MAG: hypothetical protein E7052_04670 [Lentisphaerae bacterium]|nr:hypothetical protein [Lentisphaerota bacterium]
MARYREKILPLAPTVALLVFAFFIAFAPWAAGERELSWKEGYIIAQAQDMTFTPLMLVKAHGEAIPNAQPLFPMLGRVASLLGCPLELAMRMLSMASLLGIAAVVFIVSFRTRSSVAAGAAAGAMMLTSLLAVDKTPDGFGHWLLVLILLGGHLSWYYYAALKGDWSKAWICGFAACALGFYLVGIVSLIFFLVPLIFMRRPLGIFGRLRNRGTAVGVGLLAAAVLLWYLPYHFAGVQIASVYPATNILDGSEYIKHLLTFPLDLGLRLLPWALLAWAPFCVQLQTLDATPMFSRFLRTLFLVDFFMLWITPLDEVYDWLILLPPLAIMTGLNYEIVIRRYGNFFLHLANTLAAVLLPGAGVVLLAFFLLPGDLITETLELERFWDYGSDFGRKILGITAAVMLLVSGALLWKMRRKPPVWCYWLIISFAPLLVYNCIIQPYRALEHPRRDQAQILQQALLQDGAARGVLLYKYELNDLFVEAVYLKSPVQKVTSLTMLPGNGEPVVYLLAGSFPNCPERSWRSLLPEPLETRGRKFNLWRGQWQENQVPAERKRTPLLDELKRQPGQGGNL